MDYVISSSAEQYWIVELLRDGSDASGHALRFVAEGIYAPMMEHMSGLCLVDFRGPGQRARPRSTRPDFWYVSFRADHSAAEVFAPGQETAMPMDPG